MISEVNIAELFTVDVQMAAQNGLQLMLHWDRQCRSQVEQLIDASPPNQ